jgi:hypothetical protein
MVASLEKRQSKEVEGLVLSRGCRREIFLPMLEGDSR